MRETAGAQIGKKGSRGVALQKAVCHVWSKREALLETELASSTAGCFRRSQGQRKSGRSVTQPDV